MHVVELSDGAEKALEKLPRKLQERIRARIDALADDPRPRGCTKLAARDGLYRIRSAAYRVIYTVEDERLLVLILDVGNRREVYR